GEPGRSRIQASSAASLKDTADFFAKLWSVGTSRSRRSLKSADCSKRESPRGGSGSVATTTATSACSDTSRSKHSSGSASMMVTSAPGKCSEMARAVGGSSVAAAVENPHRRSCRRRGEVPESRSSSSPRISSQRVNSSWERSSRSEEHTSELQSRFDLVCRLLLEKKKNITVHIIINY